VIAWDSALIYMGLGFVVDVYSASQLNFCYSAVYSSLPGVESQFSWL